MWMARLWHRGHTVLDPIREIIIPMLYKIIISNVRAKANLKAKI
jgi:hypothetical protein